MTRRILGAPAIIAVVLSAACGVDKSSNPLTPTVSGPIPGVNITAPATLRPTAGSKMRSDQQPYTLTVSNATTNGVRPLSYRFEISGDANFSALVVSRTDIAPGENGQTSVRLQDSLVSDRVYYWRARAEDGANTGPFSAVSSFDVFTPAVFGAPVPISPINNTVVSSVRPRFTFANAPRTGTPDGVNYTVEISDSSAFTATASASVPEQGGPTSLDAPADLPMNKQVFWRVRAYDVNSTGPWSETQTFRTPAPATGGGGGGGAGCSYPGAPASWNNTQWHDCFFSILAQRNAGPTVSTPGMSVTKADLNSLGADWQHDSAGNLRPRLFLPNPANDPFGRAVDVGDLGGPWQWIPR
jgi:hypothetical protein